MAKRYDRKALDKRARDEQLVHQVNCEKQLAENEFAEYYRKCALWYDLYRGVYTGRHSGFRNSISIPFLYSVIQSDVARKVQMSFGQFPYVNFEGYAPEDEPIAKKNELLIGVQMEDADLYLKAVDFFTCADLYGVGIMRDAWRRDLRPELVRVPHYTAPGQIEDKEAVHWVSHFDGPDVEVLDPLDCFPQPGFKRIDDMDWFIYRYYLDLDNMIEQVEGEMAMGEEPSYDPECLQKLKRDNNYGGDMLPRMYERQSVYRTPQDWSRRGEKYSKPVEVWERWGVVPTELCNDGIRNRRVVLLNGKVIARNEPNPYWHGHKPFTSFQVGDPHFFHGVGKSELLSKLQAGANRLMNHKLDTLDLSISPAILAGSGTGLDSSRPLHMSPGKVIQLDGPASEDQIRVLQPDMSGIQYAGQEIETLWRYMQQGSGIIEDTVSGGSPSREQTAREFQGRQEGVMTRLHMESSIADKMWLEEIADRFRGLNRQFLPVPKQLRLIGSVAVTNQISGQPLPEDLYMEHADLWPDYSARAVGATQSMLRSAQRQDVLQLLQASSSNPALMQMVNWGNFARQMFVTFGFRNVNELMNQLGPVQQAQQMMLGAGGPMAGGPNPAADSPENLPPLSGLASGGQ